MKVTIFTVIVILVNTLVTIHCNNTYILHLSWLPTHCYSRECAIPVHQKFIISRLRGAPFINWLDGDCRGSSLFNEEELEAVPELSTYWPDATGFGLLYESLITHYGRCATINGSAMTPIQYFQKGIDLFKSIESRLNEIESSLSVQMDSNQNHNIYRHLNGNISSEVKLICANNWVDDHFLHELVICFNEASAVTDCGDEYKSDLDNPFQLLDLMDSNGEPEEIKKQVECQSNFTIPPITTTTQSTEA
ncbi:hypothetical protein MN116_000529 [Schistosoma mekongi]|uniref:Uncharacterized protein n=1 Tax=Schistosoma mekongi TaxID=38744 RepID=A0AAE2D5H5_SCHME|nr:hypothetical protein MN116_000529 [Schistosoma mekongi]